jgi:hypothetical protein
MKEIIPPVDKKLIISELNEERFVRKTNNGNNEIYIINHFNAPNVMREIGRLREITFRDAGGGTGEEIDIDEFDHSEIPFQQLIVWQPDDQEIVGGYRYIHCSDLKVDPDGTVHSPTAELFRFSRKFIDEYFLTTIELGRSFVQPNYQPNINIRRGMYSLDNLWDGLGAVMVDNPGIRYFFGKITMYPHFNSLARDMILYFMKKYFPDPDNLMEPYEPLELSTNEDVLKNIFTGGSYDKDYKILVQYVRNLKENIPPLVNAYMNLSATMRTFGTAINHHFGEVEETGILVTIGDIYDFKVERHLSSYIK